MIPLTMEKSTMKFTKISRTLCALSAVALSILCVCVPGSSFTYRGGEHGIVTLNDWDYDFFTYIDTNLMTGEYQSVCISDAAVIRVHHNLYVQWFTKYHGVVTTLDGLRSTETPMYGTSRSNRVPFPTGTSKNVKYARVEASITIRGDTVVTSEIALNSRAKRPTVFQPVSERRWYDAAAPWQTHRPSPSLPVSAYLPGWLPAKLPKAPGLPIQLSGT